MVKEYEKIIKWCNHPKDLTNVIFNNVILVIAIISYIFIENLYTRVLLFAIIIINIIYYLLLYLSRDVHYIEVRDGIIKLIILTSVSWKLLIIGGMFVMLFA